MSEAIKEIITKFLYNDIYINYDMFYEILIDNEVNFVEGAVRHFINQLQMKHCRTTFYHSHTNKKVEYLNEILSNILMKYLVRKFIRLWNEYLEQTLFAI